jgi:hypothetical protein
MNKSLIISIAVLLVLGGIVFYVVGLPDETSQVPVDTNDSQVAGAATGGCFIGGCSNQICSDQEGAVSTCEYKEEYACYAASKCERQATGQCGWTETPEFNICMNSVLYPGADMK